MNVCDIRATTSDGVEHLLTDINYPVNMSDGFWEFKRGNNKFFLVRADTVDWMVVNIIEGNDND